MRLPGWRVPGTGAPVVAALVASALLISAAVVIQRDIRAASTLVARGLGEAFEAAGRESLGGDHYPPDVATLQQFLADHQDEGLRYVALLDDAGAVTASAGKALGGGSEDGLTVSSDRARLVSRVPPRRPPPGVERPRPSPGERRHRPRVVYEFAPLISLELKRRAGELLIIAGLCSLGVVGLALALARSLGHRERLGAELENGRRLAALGTMSAVLAHEIRNPLASLKGHAQLLAETVEADPALSPKVGRIVSEAVRLERLTNELLDFVKGGGLRRAEVDGAAVLRAAVASTGSEAIDARYPQAALPASLDADRLQQALENVLRNALQASPPGGKVQASVELDGQSLVYTVRDFGHGIPPGEEAKIFEPFVTGRTQGVGLGLAITRRIVEQHGGQLSARNAADGGAEFTLRIPREET